MKQNVRLTRMEFDQAVKRAIKRIPPEIKRHLKNILISVQTRPSQEILQEMGLYPNEPLLGMYRGTALSERSEVYPPLYPDTIVLFQEPLESMCRSTDELEEQIEITLVHEIAHFLGISEERLAELGYG